MSTVIEPSVPDMHPNVATLYSFGAGRIDIGVRPETGPEVVAVVERADFLAAVSSELGVVIIDKADLPEVAGYNATHDLVGVMALSKSSDPAALRREAFRYLAYAEHLEGHPPVDEAQVSALAALMRDTENLRNDVDKQARRLIATGKVEVRS